MGSKQCQHVTAQVPWCWCNSLQLPVLLDNPDCCCWWWLSLLCAGASPQAKRAEDQRAVAAAREGSKREPREVAQKVQAARQQEVDALNSHINERLRVAAERRWVGSSLPRCLPCVFLMSVLSWERCGSAAGSCSSRL